MKIKCGDSVVIITGKDRGQRGKVLRVLPDRERIVVEKLNLMTKHVKPGQNRPGGRIQIEAPLHVSNVKVFDPKAKKSSRVGYNLVNGKKQRFAKISGNPIETPFVKS